MAWKSESSRHALASRGIKTSLYNKTFSGKIGSIQFKNESILDKDTINWVKKDIEKLKNKFGVEFTLINIERRNNHLDEPYFVDLIYDYSDTVKVHQTINYFGDKPNQWRCKLYTYKIKGKERKVSSEILLQLLTLRKMVDEKRL